MSRCTPSGSSRSRTPSAQGSGSTLRIGRRSSRRRGGTRLPWTTHGEDDDDDDDPVEPLRRPATCAASRKLPSRIGTAPFRPGEQDEAALVAGAARAGSRHSADEQRPDHQGQHQPEDQPGTHTSARGELVPGRRSGRGRRTRRSRRGWPARSGSARSRACTAPARRRAGCRRRTRRGTPIRGPAWRRRTGRTRRPASAAGTGPRSGSGTARMNHSSGPPADDADDRADAHLQDELPGHVPERAGADAAGGSAGWPSARSRPGRSRRTRPPGWCRCARRSRAGPGRRTRPRGRWARRPSPTSSGRVPVQPEHVVQEHRGAAAAVRNVPATPDHGDRALRPRGTAASRCACRRRTGCITSATVTSRSTVFSAGACRSGTTFTATAAATSIKAGAGTLADSR